MSVLWFLVSVAGPETFSDISHDKGLAVDGIDLLVIVVVSSLHPHCLGCLQIKPGQKFPSSSCSLLFVTVKPKQLYCQSQTI